MQGHERHAALEVTLHGGTTHYKPQDWVADLRLASPVIPSIVRNALTRPGSGSHVSCIHELWPLQMSRCFDEYVDYFVLHSQKYFPVNYKSDFCW